MKNKTVLFFTLVIGLLLNVSLLSQVQFSAYVANQTVVLNDPAYSGNNTIYFEVFLQQNGGPGPLYLANADFKFTFNGVNFPAPGASLFFRRVTGSTAFFNSSGAPIAVAYGFSINSATANNLIVNVQPPAFNDDQGEFDANIAKIDATPDKHRLGKFVVYPITDLSGTFGLTWKQGVGGTVVTSYANADPWPSSPAVGSLASIPNSPLPIELSSLTAAGQGRDVNLNWSTKTEVNSSKFEVERTAANTQNWIKVGVVTAAGNSNSTKEYSFTDKKLNSGKYIYRLKMVDADGSFKYSDAVEAEVALPKEYAISQNYPNPFNPSTRIDYQLPFDSKVTLELYGITGEKVATILNGELAAGYYTSDINASALNLASGVYIYRMVAQNPSAQNFVQVKKLMLTK
jgi:hypothetical protein